MSRRRVIAPEFWEDQIIASWPPVSRLAYIALWNHSDDYGVVRACPTYLHARSFPYETNIDMREAIRPIVESGRLTLFEVSGVLYGHVTNFLKYQKVNRPSKQRNPELDHNSVKAHGVLSEDRLFFSLPYRLDPESGAASNLTPKNGSSEVKAAHSGTLTEHSVNPQPPLTDEVKLNKTTSCKVKHLPSVAAKAREPSREGSSSNNDALVFHCMFTGKAYTQAEHDEGYGWWKYYNHLGKETTPGWHEQKWVNVRSQVLQCCGHISDSDMRIAVRYAAGNRDCRFMGDKDLFVSPALIFGRPGEDVGQRLDRLLSRAKAWDAKLTERFEQQQQQPDLSDAQRGTNKKLAQLRLSQIDSDLDTVKGSLHGSDSYRINLIKQWRVELAGSAETGASFYDYLDGGALDAA